MSGETMRSEPNSASFYNKLSTEGLIAIARNNDNYRALHTLRDIAAHRPSDPSSDELGLIAQARMLQLQDEEILLKAQGEALLKDPAIDYWNQELEDTPPEDLSKKR